MPWRLLTGAVELFLSRRVGVNLFWLVFVVVTTSRSGEMAIKWTG